MVVCNVSMNVFVIYLMAILSVILLILIVRLFQYKDNEDHEIIDAILNAEELEKHAIDVARKHVVSKRTRLFYSLEGRMNKNFKSITSAYLNLNEYVNNSKRMTPASEWLLDNFYIIEEQVKEIRHNLSRRYYKQLPILKTGSLKGLPRVYAIALELVSHTDGRFDDKLLINFITAYQTQELLSSGELWAIPLMVRMALIEHIRYICDNIMQSQQQWYKAEKLAEILLEQKDASSETLLQIAKENMKVMDKITPSYGEHFLNMLKKHGLEIAPIIHYIDERLSEQHTNGEGIAQLEHNEQAIRQVSIGNSITSLRFISTLDWKEVFEALSRVEQILRQDPDNTYENMDFPSRDYYRHEIEKLTKKTKVSEIKIARKAIECSKENNKHVGCYLFGKERSELWEKIDYSEGKLLSNTFYYLFSIAILTFLIVLPFSIYSYNRSSMKVLYSVISALALLIPASEVAVLLVNWVSTKLKTPDFLPKLELKEGIPSDAKTIVVIPTLLPNPNRVKALLGQLEEYYLANREKNLYFALVGDFKDYNEKEMQQDKKIIETAVNGIRTLNSKYTKDGDIFYFFFRDRVFNSAQNRWMGWERKRGALVEFNNLLKGSKDTTFNMQCLDIKELENIKYVITIDADTKLPIETARRLIGTMLHPLNKAVINTEIGIVTEGYGLLQPRINVDIESANASFFSKTYAGQGGIDIYTSAISDVYQDLFGEGIFTGKGIYELDVFHKVLSNAFPDNSILSHDLLEGSYVRTGLLTDIELIDGFPAKYSSYSMRLHRWVRGDWQLIKWLFPKVKNRVGDYVRNPLITINKWKIIDNLRRSILAPASILLLLLGLTILPGKSYIWLFPILISNMFPIVVTVIDIINSTVKKPFVENASFSIISTLKNVSLQVMLILSFLPYQAHLMINAISKALVRTFITKKNMLEWVTAADMEIGLKNNLNSYIRRMWLCPVTAVIALLISIYYKFESFYLVLVFFVLWSIAPFTAYIISQIHSKNEKALGEEDIRRLRIIARKTWSFFEEFVGALDNYLPPDNYQENPPNGIAHRTSPTNVGLLLISTITARDFGYISTMEMLERLNKTMTTIEKLKKWKGHLYNWYDTITLEVLRPKYISTVDSGNFIAYLMTLKQGLHEYLNSPLVDKNLAKGIHDTLDLAREDHPSNDISSEAVVSFLEKESIDLIQWMNVLNHLNEENKQKRPRWGYKLYKMVTSYRKDMQHFYPCIENYDDLNIVLESIEEEDSINIKEKLDFINNCCSINEMPDKYKELKDLLVDTKKSVKKSKKSSPAIVNSLDRFMDNIDVGMNNFDMIIKLCRNLINRIHFVVEDTYFLPLFDNKRKLFSIGYNEDEEKLTKSYYDLLASEARQASFIAIARGEIKKNHWFMLDRTLTNVDGYKGLVSWTGTMFEYLMPVLLMRDYANTLLNETYKFVIKSQMDYGRRRHVPWGVSESGFYAFDFRLNYQYKAFGIPSLGLKRGLINDTVVAPYATMLGLMVEPVEAMKNLNCLSNEGMESQYGYYEAIDYTLERLPRGKKNGLVKSYMVHHQGMGFLAMSNVINDNILQDRFHSEPIIKATEILLQEKVPSKVIFAKDYKEKIEPFKELNKEDVEYNTVLGFPNKILPEAHVLSNGRYSVLVTDDGSGYSRYEETAVTRWRSDNQQGRFGTFFYIKDVESNNIWSSSISPVMKAPSKYKVVYTQDKANYHRTDNDIDTQTEIVVSPENDIEIRRLSLSNHGQQPKVIEITSYMEVVLTPQSADVAHPAFSNLFIKTEFLAKYNTLISVRKAREQHNKNSYGFHSINVDADIIGGIQYETDRSKFIGRNKNLSNPIALEANHPLSNTVGPVLDPIMSLRVRIRLLPGQTATMCFVTGVAKDYNDVLLLTEKYNEDSAIERAFELAWTRGQVELGYLGLKSENIETYRKIIAHIIYISTLRYKQDEEVRKNKRGQSSLWSFGISGDIPIVLAVINNNEQIELVKSLLKAHEFWRIKGFKVDLVIVNEDEGSYTQPLYNLIQDTVSVSHARDLREKSGGVFIKQGSLMSTEDMNLLYASARVVFKGDEGTLAKQIEAKKLNYPRAPVVWKEDIKEYNTGEIKKLDLNFNNTYGGFNESGNEYIINLCEGNTTPVPWINVIANENFGFQASESGTGYVWAENSRENKLTPWANDPTMDVPGEILYIRDEDTGEVWNITAQPIREDNQYIIRHGFGYTVYEHNSHGIEQQMLQFVPMSDSVKISKISLKSLGSKKRTLSLTYFVKPVLGVNDESTSNYIYTGVTKDKVLTVKNSFNEDFNGRTMFIDCSEIERTFTGDIREFVGRGGSYSEPVGLSYKNLSCNVGTGLNPCACMQTKIVLNKDEKKDIIFVLGQVKEESVLTQLSKKYRKINEVEEEFRSVKNYWEKLLGTIKVQTPDKSIDYMINGWLLYQTLACRMWARSALYQSGGAFGFRDQLQDSMAVAYVSPDITRKQILFHSSRQFFEGDVQHWWHSGTNKGIRTKFSDDLLWMPFVTIDYINSTNDWTILEEQTTFLDEQCLKDDEDERYNIPNVSDIKASVYEHCIRAIEHSLKFGQHGIPLMGSGDWNDGMSTVGNKGKGESIWLGWFLYSILTDFVLICRKKKDNNRADRYENIAKEISKALEENAWDGNWYRRAYFDNGVPLGSAENTECKIDSLSQSWAVISGAGREERINKAFEALEHYLINKDDGLVMLLTPPFDEGDLEPGYIKGYIPGVRENGGQYTHAAVWVVMAYAKLGMGDKAWEIYNMLNPINHTNTPMEVARYKVEPYVMAADVYAVHPHIGRGGWTWYTGAAGWMYRVGLQYILGLNIKGSKLLIDPCIPRAWQNYNMEYTYKSTKYKITVNNPSNVSKGVVKLVIDSNSVSGNIIELVNDSKVHNVEVIMGV